MDTNDTKAAKIAAELDGIAQASADGLLKPEDVVAFAARNADSALHGEFEWDDAKAAAEHRIAQARGVIRAYVTVLPGAPVRVRAFVSVPTDRANGGGYRRTSGVLKSDALRLQMVEDVLKRLEAVKTNATFLPELDPLFAQVDVLIAKYRSERLQLQAAA